MEEIIAVAETVDVSESDWVKDEVIDAVIELVDWIELEIEFDTLILFELVELNDGVNDSVSVTVADPEELGDSDKEADDVTDWEPVELIDIDNDVLIDCEGLIEIDSLLVIDLLGVIDSDKVGVIVSDTDIVELSELVIEAVIETVFEFVFDTLELKEGDALTDWDTLSSMVLLTEGVWLDDDVTEGDSVDVIEELTDGYTWYW